jgi:tetratricopeptide (TPR) repeat protein
MLTGRLEEQPDGSRLDLMLRDLGRSGQLLELELKALDRDSVVTLAERVAGQSFGSEAVASLYQETEGNPLFVIETVRAGWLAQEGERLSTENEATVSPQPLPPVVHKAIMARLTDLTPEARDLAGLAATIGREFTFDVLAHAYKAQEVKAGEELLVRALDELWQRRLIRERGEDAYDFSHGKIRDVAYADLSAARRRLYHRLVGDSLQEVYTGNLEAISGQIAGHAEMAGSPERALSFYTRAAEYAVRINAFHNAEMLYARAGPVAEQLGRPGDEIVELYTARSQMLGRAGRHDAAIQVYRDLMSLALERDDGAIEKAAIAMLVSCYLEPSDAGDPECAQPLIERGLQLARESGDHDTESWLLWIKMVGALHYGTADEAQKAGEASAAIARKYGLQERLAYVLNDLALNLRLSGNWERAQALADEARTLFQAQDNKSMLADNLNQRALIDHLRLDFDSALRHAAQGAEMSRISESDWNLSMAILLQGQVRAATGDWGAALVDFQEGIRHGKEAGFVIASTLMPSELGRLLRTIGQVEQARALHERAHATSLQRAPFLLRAVETQLAMDAFAAGRVKEGQRWLQSVLDREPSGDIGTAYLVLADPACAAVRAAERTGAWALALEMVLDAIQEAKRRRLPFYLPLLLHEQGRSLEGLERMPEAEAKYCESLALARQCGLRPLQWRSHAALARLYQIQDLAAEASTELREAVQLIEVLARSLPDSDLRDGFCASPKVAGVLVPDLSAVGM